MARFIATLQAAARANDSLTIAGLIDYQQSRGFWDGRRFRGIDTRAQFLPLYHLIFDRALRAEIAAVTGDSLFANWQGVMFNSGRVWAHTDDHGRLMIVTVNEPVQHWLARQRRSKPRGR